MIERSKISFFFFFFVKLVGSSGVEFKSCESDK